MAHANSKFRESTGWTEMLKLSDEVLKLQKSSWTMQIAKSLFYHAPPRALKGLCEPDFLKRSRISAEASKTEQRQEESEEALGDKMAEFLRQQAEKESGGRLAVPDDAPKQVIGRNVVSDEDAKRFCREVMAGVRQLREKRDMSINEIKLTVAIEDPTDRERKEYLGIEEGEGVSRDDIAAALLEVVAGKIPLDRIALKELALEVKDWPYLDAEEKLAQEDEEAEANYEGITNTGLKGKQKEKVGRGEGVAARPQLGRDKDETPSSITDMLPDWMGYGFLYLVSIIPVIIVITTIAILFFSSLK